MKISIVGASGKIGTETIRLLAEQNCFDDKLDVVLYAPNNSNKIKGLLEDIEESLLIRGNTFSQNIKLSPTSNIKEITNSDMIVICAGLFATSEEKLSYKNIDPTGRNIQSIKNYPIITSLCEDIKKHSPKASVLVVTNQSDIMTAKTRKLLGHKNVFGLGCYLDTLRFNKIFSELSGLSKDEFNATILGFHNEDMFINETTFTTTKQAPNLEELKQIALKKTISRGKEVSDLQKDIHLPSINSGSSKLPAAAIFNIIKAFSQRNNTLEIPLNRTVSGGELQIDNIIANTSAQMPCIISRGKIVEKQTALNSIDLKNLKQGIINFVKEFKNLEISQKIFMIKKERF